MNFLKDNFPDDKAGFKEAVKEIKQGDMQFLYGFPGYKNAIKHYLIAFLFNPSNAKLNFKIGRTYVLLKRDKRCLSYLQSAYKLNPNIHPDILYYLGQAYHCNLQLDDAIKHFEKYQETYTDKVSNNRRAKVTKNIEECKTGIELIKNPVRVFIDNIGASINTSFQEYAPVITADESVMMITSRRPATTGGKKDEGINDYMEDVYISHHVDGEWTALENISKPINTTGHDASVGLSPDGQRMMIYIDDKVGHGDLYECKLKGTEWSRPKNWERTSIRSFTKRLPVIHSILKYCISLVIK
ncbi:MAG: tetratricopeptide repeat protein [Flavobacteriales bacterium]|nr:tetratricopeptide repeat protein [Flavobacteriales bacterium]